VALAIAREARGTIIITMSARLMMRAYPNYISLVFLGKCRISGLCGYILTRRGLCGLYKNRSIEEKDNQLALGRAGIYQNVDMYVYVALSRESRI